MTLSSKNYAAAAAIAFACALVTMTAPARADDYCISNGAQAAHGCGYPSMEACRSASAGIGGSCSLASSSKSPSDALASQAKPSHSHRAHARSDAAGN